MRKTIIIFWGTQNQGKTSTIQLVNEELIFTYINPLHTYSFPLPRKDISTDIMCLGFKVGIESSGDDLYYYNLKKKLDDFIVVNSVDVLICACRLRNNVAKYLEHLAKTHNYRILWVTNHRSDTSFNQDHLNLLSAKEVVLLTDQILKGTI